MSDDEITAIVGWPTGPEMVKYRKVSAAAVASERERWKPVLRALLAAKWCTPEYDKACRDAASLTALEADQRP